MQPGKKLFTDVNCFTGRQRRCHLAVTTRQQQQQRPCM